MSALATRALNPLVWRLPGRAARKLRDFACTEQSSMLDLMVAARLTRAPERAALYLRHALDEQRHARTFTKRAAELDPAGASFEARADTEALFERLGEERFVAFVHLGEARGCARFEAHRDYFTRSGDARTASMFEAILVDERRHTSYTWTLLVALSGSEPRARLALRRAALWEAWRIYRRAGRTLAQALYVALMWVLYVLVAPLALLVRLARPERAGWTPRA